MRTLEWLRAKVLGTVVVSFLFLPACHDDEADKKKLAELQKNTDERVAKAEREAREKVAEAEKQIEQLKAEMAATTAKLKAEADDAVSKAQASAEEQAKAAEAALKKARQGFKEEGRLQLANLNKEVSELSAKSAKAPAKVKTEVTKAMQKIVTQQKAIAKDIAAFDTATLDKFGATKAKLAQDLAAMKATIHAARAKVP
ncbi:MAG TPA: hypothetical protein VG937_37395 [Polyangiaceae bacterium]|nr:hypothetical protein [Polyangiaceae bacterium]